MQLLWKRLTVIKLMRVCAYADNTASFLCAGVAAQTQPKLMKMMLHYTEKNRG